MAMVQFNLLPDVKLAYIKAERQKQVVLSISAILSIGAVVLFLLLFSYANAVQRKSINDLTNDIKTSSEDLTGTKDLSKILTVQNQINSLSSIYDQRIANTRILDYMEKLTILDFTPRTDIKGVSFQKLEVDYEEGTIKVSGTGYDLATINTFVDSMKFSKYTMTEEGGKESASKAAFTDVVLSSVSIQDKERPKFEVTAKLSTDLFLSSNQVTFILPNQITTRSVTERPGSN